MTERELFQYYKTEKKLRVLCEENIVIEGVSEAFVPALDNEPEVPSIILRTKDGLIEITLPEIESIERLE